MISKKILLLVLLGIGFVVTIIILVTKKSKKSSCSPSCENKCDNQNDGCDGICDCPDGQTCYNDNCCIPANEGKCENNFCGDLGCGLGQCNCPSGQNCISGTCQFPACPYGLCNPGNNKCIGDCPKWDEETSCVKGICMPRGCPTGNIDITALFPLAIPSGMYNIRVYGTPDLFLGGNMNELLRVDDVKCTNFITPWYYDNDKWSLSTLDKNNKLITPQARDNSLNTSCDGLISMGIAGEAIAPNFILIEVLHGIGYIYSVQSQNYLRVTNCTKDPCVVCNLDSYIPTPTDVAQWTFTLVS